MFPLTTRGENMQVNFTFLTTKRKKLKLCVGFVQGETCLETYQYVTDPLLNTCPCRMVPEPVV